jgi:sucrose-6-phosphate hydrolase SacC (GH32 family)
MRSRPTKHFTPKNNWINDPNGLIYHGGYYHLYFQHNPLENKWGHMSWGHARSKDLINWEELAVAIPEQPEHMIFSGSAVFDAEINRLAAFYTAHKKGNQSQWVAFSYDGGETYKELQQVLDLHLEEFRDPKVFKFQNHWIMVVVKSPQHLISFFKSTDLVNWEFLSDYRMPTIEILYECPDLFELDGTWVLFLSTNPGGRAGGSGMHYVLGNFDGRTFKESTEVRYLDYGPDYYAAVTYNDTKERISMAWMNNWDYANKLKREIWNGSMNTPRKLRVIDGQLIQTFIGATEKFVITEKNFNLIYANGKLKFKSENGKLIIDRSELWSSSLKTFDLPTTAPFNIEAIYDAESIELSINGHFVSAQLEVGPETPEIERI